MAAIPIDVRFTPKSGHWRRRLRCPLCAKRWGNRPAPFTVTRNKWRDEMIKRGAARYNSETGKWEWGEPPKKPKAWEVQ